jgi:hypothetical protein
LIAQTFIDVIGARLNPEVKTKFWKMKFLLLF